MHSGVILVEMRKLLWLINVHKKHAANVTRTQNNTGLFFQWREKIRLTLFVCAGGQSSSRTPNVTPAGVFFSKGLLMIPAMPIFQAVLSRGGLESSDGINARI